VVTTRTPRCLRGIDLTFAVVRQVSPIAAIARATSRDVSVVMLAMPCRDRLLRTSALDRFATSCSVLNGTFELVALDESVPPGVSSTRGCTRTPCRRARRPGAACT